MRFSSRLVASVSFVALASSLNAAAPSDSGCYREQAKLTASDGAPGDFFGWAVSLDGDTALVGAFSDENGAGAAYVFVRSGTSWTQQAKLVASDGVAGDFFGAAVSLSGDTALVGAFGDDDNGNASGSAYVFVRTGTSWTQQAKLVASDGAPADSFGTGLCLDGDTAVVGAYHDDDNGPSSGSFYVFVRNGTVWTQQAKLLPSDGAAQDSFAAAIHVSGDTVLAGATGDDDAGTASGSVYVFVRSGTSWTQQAKLVASDGAASSGFGYQVCVDGDMAVVGAPGEDQGSENSGAAYVFRRVGSIWIQETKLKASDGASLDAFGQSVDLEGDALLAGTFSDDDNGFDSGAAYAFVRHGAFWTQQAKLLPNDGAAEDHFAMRVALSGGTALAGAFGDDDTGFAAGAAYVFVLPPRAGTLYCTCAISPCGNPDRDAGCANTTGAGAQLTAYGTTLPDAVGLFVEGARPSSFAIFVQGDDAVMFPFGDGFRCADGNMVKLTSPPISTDVDGSASFGPCSGDPTISSVTGVVPGSGVTKRYQFWYRDPGGPCASSFNLSNGYEITW